MENDINQLIEDIKNARNKTRPPKMELPPELEFVRSAEEYLHGEFYAMGSLFGLEKMQFPPVEKLTGQQVSSLVHELEGLWEAFNFYPDFPDGLPDAIKYKLMVEHLDHETTYTTCGQNHFEFCSYEPENCPFPPEYCRCKDFIVDDFEMPDPKNESNMPF